MASRTAGSVAIAAGLLVWPVLAPAQTELTLEQAQSRVGPDFVSAHAGTRVVVHGTVATPAVWAIDSFLLGIRDEAGYGLALRGQAADFTGIAAGDRISATGTIVQRAGMAVLSDFRIEKRGSATPPAPLVVPLDQIERFRYLGLPVATQGSVLEIRHGETGDSLVLGAGRATLEFFIPKRRGDLVMDGLAPFRVGDTVRVKGLAVQQCMLPPYDRSFQIVAYEGNPVALLERPAGAVKYLLSTALLSGLVCLVWYVWNRRLEKRRNAMKSLNELGEEILTAGSDSEILDKLAEVIPAVSGATGVRLYEFNRKTRTLNRVPSPAEPDPMPINPDAPSGPLGTGAALAFRGRTIVNVPDTRRSPLFKARGRPEVPRSVMFVPMFAQDEAMGVLEVDHDGGIRYFTQDEQAAVQHLANQVAAALKLLEEQTVREQLFRGEKLAATAQLISGIAAELKTPLESLLAASNRLLGRRVDPSVERELRAVAEEAQRASEIVTRLVSFGRAGSVTPRIVELNDLVSGLLRFREREWKAQGIRVQEKLWSEPLHVMAAQGQLEQVFLSILVHAEQSAPDCPDRTITVGSVCMAKRAVVEIAFACPEGARDPFLAQAGAEPGGLGLAVVRGIVGNHGGEARFSRTGKSCCIEVDLPAAQPDAATARLGSPGRKGRPLTTLIVDPDPLRQRRLVKELTRRNHRAVPLARAEEALDLVARARFDIVVCSSRLPGLNWAEFVERTRGQVGAYVSIGLAADPAGLDAGAGGPLILEDVTDDAEFERVLAQAESMVETPLTLKAKV